MSINIGTDKEDVVHIYNGLLLTHKKEWNNAVCGNMDEPRDCHTEWSMSDSERQISYNIAYMWNLKKKGYKWTYLQNRNWVTDVKNKLMVTIRERGGGINWEIGIDIYTLL